LQTNYYHHNLPGAIHVLAKGKRKKKQKTVEEKRTLCNIPVLRDRGKESNGRILSGD
jgi:hypothetical protein